MQCNTMLTYNSFTTCTMYQNPLQRVILVQQQLYSSPSAGIINTLIIASTQNSTLHLFCENDAQRL